MSTDSPDLILHHYPLSPFAEKIRCMLGYADLPWSSCLTSEAPPREDFVVLTGGYNRIPVLQEGADIYCDTNIIAEELGRLSDNPKLSAQSLTGEQKEEHRRYETKLFFACVNAGFSLSLIGKMIRQKGLLNILRFFKDRLGMAKSASISLGSSKSAPHIIEKHVKELTAKLGEQTFFGGGSPNIIDFSLFHPFWFTQYVGSKKIFSAGTTLDNWYSRMKVLTKPAVNEISPKSAIETARDCQPRTIDANWLEDDAIGKDVAIAPSDYRKDEVVGKLVGASESRYVLELSTEKTGVTHLHFPRANYTLKEIN